ncbi:mitochondrial Complex I (CI) NADH:ubiquinone oxidoreductase subunit 39-kDa/NUEM/NDUFA9 form 2 [Andalucia godoyi]|uniref:Mitochondrial Complex I (CI) NADH:ubiquinone oxidoreductase subunit 39-kDa/NUEM/NDUFA9 form 2 n=1 Tax=Andalucia godoyi TaxID=505711 RepID=A0A8K0AIX8_ANDGO|nr:mitochondrial Complex I (CI) NADH:ubiquinone oxidoreductase subunit 39-kDa/NUEM/NDUFA9 form 2 [Andalucia godoyi]|eukprot:ANDGO_05310.mRNA.1 mitochondrial Complex I (CI) NADH:ubiquinone oxidoreductase subunit 39-kDa/NUEM/NDUFA9 form 2
MRGTVSVIGGSGFLGRSIVSQLTHTFRSVRVISRHGSLGKTGSSFSNLKNIEFVSANIADESSIRDAIQGSESIVNLVGILHETSAQTFESAHVCGTRNLANASRSSSEVKDFVQISAIGADPLSDSKYASSKGAAEQILQDLAKTPLNRDAINVTILRPSVVFGPEDSFLNLFASMAKYVPVVPLIGGGATRFQPVYVKDLAAAVQKVLEPQFHESTRAAAAISGGTSARGEQRSMSKDAAVLVVECGGPKVYTFSELMDVLGKGMRKKLFKVSIPFWLADLEAAVLEKLPTPLLTRDQVKLLRRDNIIAESAITLADIGVYPTPLESIIPQYSWAR